MAKIYSAFIFAVMDGARTGWSFLRCMQTICMVGIMPCNLRDREEGKCAEVAKKIAHSQSCQEWSSRFPWQSSGRRNLKRQGKENLNKSCKDYQTNSQINWSGYCRDVI